MVRKGSQYGLQCNTFEVGSDGSVTIVLEKKRISFDGSGSICDSDDAPQETLALATQIYSSATIQDIIEQERDTDYWDMRYRGLSRRERSFVKQATAAHSGSGVRSGAIFNGNNVDERTFED